MLNGILHQQKPLWRREFMFQLLIMKLDCLNKCKLAQDSMKCKTCETPRTSVNLRTFSVPRGQIPRILKTCIVTVLKFPHDLISGEIIFPHLRKKWPHKKHRRPQLYTHIFKQTMSINSPQLAPNDEPLH